jgi:threonine/homoserine/homoserine lactone efflux protein
VEWSLLVAFVGVAATLVAVPGPDWALILAVGSRAGAVMNAVLGLAAGYVLITAVVALGVARLVAAAPAALVTLTLLGGAYLIWLGVGILHAPADAGVAGEAGSPPATGSAVLRGMGVSALNPKSLLFFLAFLPQFAKTSAPWPFAAQLAVLGGVWILIAAGFYTVLGLGLQRVLMHRPGLSRGITWIAGAAMFVVGIGLLAEQALPVLGA